MDDASTVEVFDPTQQLVEEVGHSVVVQLDTDDPTQVGIHQLHHNVAVGGGGRGVVEVQV